MLVEGQIALFRAGASGPASVILEVVEPPGYFVLSAALTRLPYIVGARTLKASRVRLIPVEQLDAEIEKDGRLGRALLRTQAMNLRALIRQTLDLKSRTAAGRLGCYLLARTNDPDAKTADFLLPFDKRTLAGRIGCRQENLSRAFAVLRSFGVETHGSRVILHDVSALREFAVPDGLADPDVPFSA